MIEQFLIRQSALGNVTNLLISAGTLSSNRSDVTFANSNGVSFGLNTNGVITASAAGGAGGGAGTGFTTATTVGTNVVGTLSTNGLSMGVPAYLTTAALSQDSSKYAGTGFTTATTAGTNIVGTLNTAGISMGVPAYLTTAMQSNAATISNINVSAGTTSNNLSAITFSNSNNVSFGLNGSTLTGSIATTYAGTGITTTTTAGTAIVGTLNTSGLSLGVPAFLTTADLSQNSSKYAGTAGAITGGSITVNTSGVSVNVPIATLSLFENIPLIQGTTAIGAGVSRIDVTQMILPQCLSAAYFRLFGSISQNSSNVTGTSANTSFTVNDTQSMAMVIYTQGTGANSLSLQYSTSTLCSWVFQTAVTAGAVGSNYTISFNITYPTQGTTSLFQTNYASTLSAYNVATGSLTGFTGAKYIDIPFAQSMTPGNYWIGLGTSTNTAGAGAPAGFGNAGAAFSYVAMTQATTVYGFPGVASNVSNQIVPGVGSWSTNSAVLSTSSLGLANISFRTAENAKIPFQFIRQA